MLDKAVILILSDTTQLLHTSTQAENTTWTDCSSLLFLSGVQYARHRVTEAKVHGSANCEALGLRRISLIIFRKCCFGSLLFGFFRWKEVAKRAGETGTGSVSFPIPRPSVPPGAFSSRLHCSFSSPSESLEKATFGITRQKGFWFGRQELLRCVERMTQNWTRPYRRFAFTPVSNFSVGCLPR